jgi:hypothetical protein
VEKDAARQDECADEEEHQGIGERGEDLLRGGHLKHDRGRSAKQRRDREWQRLGYPEDHDRGQHRCEAVRWRRESLQRKAEE